MKENHSVSRTLESVNDQLNVARHEARYLYREVENMRKKIKNTTLFDSASLVPEIAPEKIQIMLYNTLHGHQDKIARIKWSSDSTKILSNSQDGYMIIWDAVLGFKKQAIVLENPWVLTCAISPSGELMGCGGLDNACTIYKMSLNNDYMNFLSYYANNTPNLSLNIQSIFKGHTAYISDCEFIDDSTLISTSGDSTCAMWDLVKGCKVRDYLDHMSDVLCLSISPAEDKKKFFFISGSSDGYVKLWDSRSKNSTQNLYVSSSDVNCLKYHLDGNFFIAGTDDGSIRLFDLRSDCELACYSISSQMFQEFLVKDFIYNQPSHSEKCSPNEILKSYNSYSPFNNPSLFSIDFSISGRLIYACYSEFGCLIWDTLKNRVIGKFLTGHSNKINQVSVSPDGLAIATASWDTTMKIWSI